MNLDNAKIKEILVRENYVSEDDYTLAESSAKESQSSVVEYLLSHDLITNDLLGQAIAESLGVQYADLNSNQPTKEQVLKIPEEIARKSRVVLYQEEKQAVTVTTDDPRQEGLVKTLKPLFVGKKITIMYSLAEDIEQSLLHYQKTLETRLSQIVERGERVAPEILEEIFDDAYTFKASDIHFEPQREKVVVRFRVDGVLHEAGCIPKEYYENVLNRIKVQSRLRIDEHFAAQDGSLRHEKGEKIFDIRTSIVPTVEGEKVVLRLLAAYVKGFALADLGLSVENQAILNKASRKPFGMILISGPTGSGKTTTLYAVLKILARPEVNITSIEDPVEYKLLGANQIQVNPQTNLTFAKGLRAIVRQDPDIILVGEIRDTETAEIAVNAALTGHLLLSTFHANDAATAIPRLLDMGIEPFLLASTLEVVGAQRLVRKICDHCKQSIVMNVHDMDERFSGMKKYFKEKEITLYAGKGCTTCGHTGYHGRIGIFEFISMTPEMQELILTQPSTQEIWKLAKKMGTQSLFDDGMEKVKNGVTTIEELLRVAQSPEK